VQTDWIDADFEHPKLRIPSVLRARLDHFQAQNPNL